MTRELDGMSVFILGRGGRMVPHAYIIPLVLVDRGVRAYDDRGPEEEAGAAAYGREACERQGAGVTTTRASRALVAGALLLLALVALVGGSIYAGSAWFYVPPPDQDPDRLYKPLNAFLGWLLAGGGTGALASVAMLITRSTRAKRGDYLAFIGISSVGWLACGFALNVGLSSPGAYIVTILVLGDACVAYAIVRYIVARHILGDM